MPLAILMPDCGFTLIEATGKKARFLEEAATTLELYNVAVVNERAETIGRDRESHRGHDDVVVARAVGILPVLLELRAFRSRRPELESVEMPSSSVPPTMPPGAPPPPLAPPRALSRSPSSLR